MNIEGSLLEKACQGVSSLHLPACVKDSELRYICVNAAYARFAGKSAQDFPGQSSRIMFGTADDVEREDKERRCLVFATDEIATCRGILADAQTLRCERFIDETGRIFLYEVFENMPDFQGVSQPDRMGAKAPGPEDVEEDGRHHNAATEALLQAKTPLGRILDMAKALARTNLDVRQKAYAATIVHSGNALLRSLDAVLSASGADASAVLQTSHFDPTDLVEEIASLLSFYAEEKGLTLFTDIDASAKMTIDADEARFRQIVTHLVSNAIRFTHSGHVIIRLIAKSIASGATISLKLTVEDTGVGMSRDQLGSILDQSGRSTLDQTGLAQISRVVSLLDGEIAAESDVKKGSVFSVTLPVPVVSRPAAPAWPVDASILIIDGNAISRDILTRRLRDWGLDAYAIEDGTTGLAILEEAVTLGLSPAAVLLDEDLPNMGADEVFRRLRRHPLMRGTPVILLTSLREAKTCGTAQAYIAKPVRTQKLREALEALLPLSAVEDVSSHSVTETGALDAPIHSYLPQANRRVGSSIDVLVAEDDDVNQIVFSQILQQAGLDFRIVGNGKQAVEAWHNENPSLILMDVSMPVMSGYQAAQSIRQMEDDEDGRLGRVSIIGVTEHALDLDSELCLASGMDDYISKPISPEVLRAKISQWLSKRALEAL
ncbi:response regulator [Agrobacterium larrymoorei]|uniref:response regulator n=1 Tax=Agrobacterium larrymoorei TaxID=160699 RepID=UPI0030BE8A8C